MKGPFTVIYKDYFGEVHKTIVWAQTSEEAIKIFERKQEYFYEIIDAYIDSSELLKYTQNFNRELRKQRMQIGF